MKIRLGYVAISLKISNSSTSKTITLKNLTKTEDNQKRLYKLRKILDSNLSNLLRVLIYNKAYNIHVYRITSKLVPLSTHEITRDWEYIKEFNEKFNAIGNFVKENNMRISAHPNHYTVINSNSKKVFENSLKDLEYHNKLFNAMNLDSNYKLVTHVGGEYKDKDNAIKRFIEGYNKIPKEISKRIILENDDKIYNIEDVLSICNELSIPMVLDVHHHNCNSNEYLLENYLEQIFDTWNDENNVPKIHFSSPKSEKQFRSHADDINIDEFISFLKIAKKLDRDFDVMIEAKNKDLALFKLVEELKEVHGIKLIDESTFEY